MSSLEVVIDADFAKSTLIVTPPALQSQWIDELKTHAPSLKVLVYEGWSKVVPKPKTKPKKVVKDVKARATSRHSRAKVRDNSPRASEPENMQEFLRSFDWPTEANKYDVIITTYQVLKADFDVARAVPTRPRRENVTYSNVERPRSPLVVCEWYRVVMDEVQMVGGGKTE